MQGAQGCAFGSAVTAPGLRIRGPAALGGEAGIVIIRVRVVHIPIIPRIPHAVQCNHLLCCSLWQER